MLGIRLDGRVLFFKLSRNRQVDFRTANERFGRPARRCYANIKQTKRLNTRSDEIDAAVVMSLKRPTWSQYVLERAGSRFRVVGLRATPEAQTWPYARYLARCRKTVICIGTKANNKSDGVLRPYASVAAKGNRIVVVRRFVFSPSKSRAALK